MNCLSQLFYCIVLLTDAFCERQKISFNSSEGFNLNKPEKSNMAEVLNEISGIAFNKRNSDTIYAEQDEEGKLFHFKLGEKKMLFTKFGKHGDFADVSICNGCLHLSALTQNPFTKEWYILSSVNKLLVFEDKDWKIKEVNGLNPSLFPQPEGIAFDNRPPLHISNECNTAAYATMLKFVYQKN